MLFGQEGLTNVAYHVRIIIFLNNANYLQN